MSQPVDIRVATEHDLPSTIEMLRAAGLPTEDLSVGRLAFVAEINSDIKGAIGLETFGDGGLLRSLIVLPNAQGEGVGSLLVRSLEQSARERGIRELWLLTIDADGFFSRFDFIVRSRNLAPDSIRRSEEFSTLCPDDAVLMSKSL